MNSPSQDQLQIDMLVQKKMNWLIPLPIKFLVGCRVPPILVEFPVAEFGDFGKNVCDVLEYNIKQQDEEESAGEHAPKDQLNVPIFVPRLDYGNEVFGMNHIGH